MGFNEKYNRGIVLLILLLSVITGTIFIQKDTDTSEFDENSLSTSAPEDSYEPNNDPLSAYDLTMYELTWLSMIHGPAAQWDEDWYKIIVSPGEERLIVKLMFHHLEGDIDLAIYNSSIDWIASSTFTEDGEFIDIIVPSGQYYILVYYGNMGNQYDLLWDDMDPYQIDDIYEENDGSGSPHIISGFEGMWLSEIGGLGVQGDDDWFEFYINSGFERLVIDCIFSNNLGNIDLDIYNSSLVRITESWTISNNEFIDFELPSSGVYYIRLHYGNGNNTYDLRWMTFVPGDDLFENNDDYWEARWIDPNYYSNLMIVDGDDDWFQLYLNHGDTIEVYIYFSNIVGNLNLEIYNPFDNTTYQISSHSPTTDSEYIYYTADSSGDWRIRIYHEDANSTVSYDLDIWLYSGDDWAEENDNFSSARWIDPGYYGGLIMLGYDDDWFMTYLESGDIVNILIKFDHNIGDLNLELFHPDGSYITGSYDSTPSFHEEFISFSVHDPGEWRFLIYRTSGFADLYYDLEIWVEKRYERDDPYEWNNEPWDAYNLIGDEQIWLSDIHGLAVSGDNDWYKIFITPGFLHLIVDLKFNNSLGNLDIEVLARDSIFNNINYSTTSVDDIDINCPVPHPGVYYIHIFGDLMGNKYDLAWDDLRTDFRAEDNFEDNDDASSAYDLTHEIQFQDQYGIEGRSLWQIDNNCGIQSDNDWFKFHLEPGFEFLELVVHVYYEYSEGVIGISLYDSSLNKLAGNFTMEDDEYLKFVLPSNGTYYLRFYGENIGSPYDFRWRLQEEETSMIPGYDVFILLGGILGISIVVMTKVKRSKEND